MSRHVAKMKLTAGKHQRKMSPLTVKRTPKCTLCNHVLWILHREESKLWREDAAEPAGMCCSVGLTAGQMMQRRAVKLPTNFCSDKNKEFIWLHTNTYLLLMTIRGEFFCGSQTDGNRWTWEGIKSVKTSSWCDRRRITRRSLKVHSGGNVSFHFKFIRFGLSRIMFSSSLCRRLTHQNKNIGAQWEELRRSSSLVLFAVCAVLRSVFSVWAVVLFYDEFCQPKTSGMDFQKKTQRTDMTLTNPNLNHLAYNILMTWQMGSLKETASHTKKT